MANTQNQLTPQQRALNFSLATRQYKQPMETISFSELQTKMLQLPKSRFLSKITLIVRGTFKATHATKTNFQESIAGKENILRQIRIGLNNGFNLFQISGHHLKTYNKMSYKNIGLDTADVYGTNLLETHVSSSGAVNKIAFDLELPITINERDTVGLILLQNESTVVNLAVDFNQFNKLAIATDSDVTFSDVDITITPVLETYSIPAVASAIPDYSIAKSVREQSYNVVSSGDVTIKLPVGLTYRRILLYLGTDANNTPLDPSFIDSIQVAFNQADTPYVMPARLIEVENRKDYQGALPKGYYAIDFTNQGIANYGGARDYIDTERLTEFWLKINFNQLSGNTNYIDCIYENLARLV